MRHGFWRKCRLCFRWFRRGMLLATVAAICAALWLNRVGLPDFLKAHLVAELQHHGINLDFNRMRISLTRGLVADGVSIGDGQSPNGLSLKVTQVQMEIDYLALLHRRLQLDGIVIRDGRLVWPLQSSGTLFLDDIQTELGFGENDTWSLNNFRAEFSGAKLNLSGQVAHAPEVLDWKVFQTQKSTNAATGHPQSEKFLAELAKLHFTGKPQLSLNVNGDARDIKSFTARLNVTEARTQFSFDGHMIDADGNCGWHVKGVFDPEIVRFFMPQEIAAHTFKILDLKQPVSLEVNGSSLLNNVSSICARGSFSATNFAVRAEKISDATSVFYYTNGILGFVNPVLHSGGQMLMADSVTLDLNRHLILFTNGLSTAFPQSIANAIGPISGRIMEPYHFLKPPTTKVNGQVGLRDMEKYGFDDTDITFEVVKGVPFESWKFKSTNVTGIVHWSGDRVILTNMAASFYGGSGSGYANFDVSTKHAGTDFNFLLNANNLDLHALMIDLSSPTNSLQGTLSLALVVTKANTRNPNSWNGFGEVTMSDGLLWQVPIFGIFSPLLNKISSGLGDSRATDATSDFFITNSVIYTDSLEIRSTLCRLEYVGTIDFQQNVNARVTAEILRDNPVGFGRFISKVFWPVSKLFEYKVTGTISNPKSEPVYVPKILLMPLHPIQTIQELVPEDFFTNSPPQIK